jgi:hypothetical protein
MTKIQEIENAVSQLPKSDLDKFRSWFNEFDSKAWDRQFAEDVHSGRLDSFADQALRNLKSGRCSPL